MSTAGKKAADAGVEPQQEPTIFASSLPGSEEAIVSSPQDGGLRAWLQVVGGFLLWFNLWGYTFAFGSFQNYYDSEYLRGTTPSTIAWIGSIQTFLLIISGVYTGPLFDMGYFISMMYAGALLSTFGAFMLSLSTAYWQILLTQGVCIGLGCGVLFIPCMALITRSFQKRRALAVGMMSCGAPVGSIIYTFIFEGLITNTGFAWTARAMAFFMLGSYALSFPLLFWRTNNTGMVGAGGRRRLIDKQAFADIPWWSYSLAVATQFMAYLIPFFFMPNYAQVKLGTSIKMASYVLVIAQAASVPGRIMAAVAANFVGAMIPWLACCCISGIMCFVWIAVSDIGTFTTFAAIYGCFSGALIPLPPSVFPNVVQDPRVLGTRLGMAQAVSSIANMIGPPIAGALLKVNDTNGQNWRALQTFSGAVLLLAGCQIAGLWVLLVKQRNTKILV